MAQSINLKNSYENSILIVNGTRVYLIVGPEICFQMTTALITIATYTAYKWKKSLYLNMTYSWLYMSCWHLKISMNAFTYSAIEKCILPEITVHRTALSINLSACYCIAVQHSLKICFHGNLLLQDLDLLGNSMPFLDQEV